MDRPPPDQLYEPLPRWGHVTVEVGGRVYAWCGYADHGEYHSPSLIEVFDPLTGLWHQQPTTGEIPPAVQGCAYATIGSKLYVFGGWDGSLSRSSLHELDLSTMVWREVRLRNPSDGPQRKNHGGMVAHGDHSLVVCGGLIGGRNCTDELHVFNLKEGTWSSPRVSGTPPPPCHSFSLTKTDKHHALMFGGYTNERGSVNDVYLLDMQNWHWTKVTTSGPSSPGSRVSHAACCIAGPLLGSLSPQLFVTGGYSGRGSAIAVAWVLDLQSKTWMKVDVPDGVRQRFDHTLTVVSSGPTSVQLVEFGGRRKSIEHPIAATAVLQLEVDKDQTQAGGPLVWRVADVATTAEPQRWKQRLELLQKLRSVRDLLEQKQTVAIKAASLILIGIPRSGKSSLLQRVLDPYADITPQPSTPVAESPIPVTIKKVSPITATVTGSKWSKQDLEDEKLHLIQHSLREAAAAKVESKPSSKTTSIGITPETEANIAEAKAAKNASRRLPFWKTQFGENIQPSASLHPQPQRTTSTQAEPQGTSPQKYSHPISFETPDDMIASIARSAARLDSEEEQLLCCLSEKPSELTATQRMWYGHAPSDEKLKDATKLPLSTDGSFDRVDDATLEEDSLFNVLSELVDVTNWRKLGLALGLKPSTLDKIKINHREDVDDCKSDMLESWLKMQDGVMKRGYPSWRTLVVALNSPVVRCSDIAHRIACEHQESLPT